MPDVLADDYWGPDAFREQRGHPTRVGRSARALDREDAARLWSSARSSPASPIPGPERPVATDPANPRRRGRQSPAMLEMRAACEKCEAALPRRRRPDLQLRVHLLRPLRRRHGLGLPQLRRRARPPPQARRLTGAVRARNVAPSARNPGQKSTWGFWPGNAAPERQVPGAEAQRRGDAGTRLAAPLGYRSESGVVRPTECRSDNAEPGSAAGMKSSRSGPGEGVVALDAVAGLGHVLDASGRAGGGRARPRPRRRRRSRRASAHEHDRHGDPLERRPTGLGRQRPLGRLAAAGEAPVAPHPAAVLPLERVVEDAPPQRRLRAGRVELHGAGEELVEVGEALGPVHEGDDRRGARVLPPAA